MNDRNPEETQVLQNWRRRIEYLGLTEEDGERLRRLWPVLEPEGPAIAEEFYDHLLRFPETRRLLEDPERVERLKRIQEAYLAEVFQGVYDEDYCRRKLRIGQAHHRIGLDSQWYVGAYHLYHRLLYPRIVRHLRTLGAGEEEITATLLALSRVMTLDLELALEAYFLAQNAALRQEKERLAMLSERLRQANAELSALKNQLEEKVAERTEQLRRSEARLRQSEKLAAIGKMASMMAHEIRNPLSSVILNLELLGDELEVLPADRAQEARELLDLVLRELQRMNLTIRDYLAVVRPPKVSLSVSDLNAVVSELVEFVQEEVQRARVRLHVNLNPELPSVCLDPEQFRLVILNLIKNSLQAMPQGGELYLWTDMEDGRVVLGVRDTGEGIPPEHMEKIFQPLFTTKEKGLGMGLAFVQEMVQAHEGEVRCESEVERGTTFWILLPPAE
ncbi:MAG: hypothetical protein KatS3mg115_2584 [Candidatus Poribacteria bacterium]|nr:MAG: hypothetical protein KatS3mg115_2584 [Candidatus Poribacteria bacterium]